MFLQNMKKKKEVSFTKILVLLVYFAFFWGAILGTLVVLTDPSQLGAFLAYMGTPTVTVIGFYCWKAKAENVVKIKQEHPDIDTDKIADMTSS